MDPWLEKNLVCPRDLKTLVHQGDSLGCPDGHRYPVVLDIPVMLIEEVEWTHPACHYSWQEAKSISGRSASAASVAAIDPFVQESVAATCGYMYRPAISKLKGYPIPELRMKASAPNQYFLDIGCNWGRWCAAAAKNGFIPIGIDPNLGAVQSAKRVAKQLGVEAHFIVGDGRHLPFASQSIDAVFSYSVLQHFSKENVKTSLVEIKRVLKPQGRSFIQMPNSLGVRSLYHQLLRKLNLREKGEIKEFEVRYWTPKELLNTFKALIGPSALSVDGYFSLNAQTTDLEHLPFHFKAVVRISDFLRALSLKIPSITGLADSLYISSSRT